MQANETEAMREQQRRFIERMDAEDAKEPKDLYGRTLRLKHPAPYPEPHNAS